MTRFSIFAGIFFLFCSSALAGSAEKSDYKIPPHVFIIENLFLPGAGHIYNDHLGLAFMSFFGTVQPLAMAIKSVNSARDHDWNDRIPYIPTLADVALHQGQNCYNRNRAYRYDLDSSNAFFFLAILNYMDSLVESYHAANEGWDDNMDYSIGLSGFVSAMRTRSFISEGANVGNAQDAQKSIGVAFSVNYGRIFEKEFYTHIGPHFVMSYNYSYPIKLASWLSISVGNYFDMQKRAFSLRVNAPWTSYDRYTLLSNVVGLGISARPIKWLSFKAGFGVFNIATVWKSFSGFPEGDQEDGSFSQKHAGKTGLMATTYIWGSARADLTDRLFLSGLFKYISSAEPSPNYDTSLSYVDFIRLEAIIGVSF